MAFAGSGPGVAYPWLGKRACGHGADLFERLLGLLAPVYRAGMRADGVAIVFPCCSSVHTWFMKRDLDIVFLDREGAMLRVYWGVKPGRLIFCSGASLAIERVSTKEFPGQE